LAPTGERVWQPINWFTYGYRSSRLKRAHQPGEAVEPAANWIVLQAEIAMTLAPAADVQARLAGFNERRKTSQPPGASMGSMFKNPPGDYAGRLIEAAGLKGYRLGQAQISPVHANFFQNLGGATAAEMLALIETVQDTVSQKFEIELELEIEIVGDKR
jgi:UDP-N-acetylmuramate dehydrogenase